MSRTWIRAVPVALILLLVASLVWRLANPPETEVKSEMVGKSVPAFQLAAAVPATAPLGSTDLAGGKPKLVNFFASWCVPCIGEAPILLELKRQGVPIVGIAVRDRPDDLANFLAENGNPFERIGADSQSRVQLAFGSAGVPESFIVDGHGVIRMQHIGPIDAQDVAGILTAMKAAQ